LSVAIKLFYVPRALEDKLRGKMTGAGLSSLPRICPLVLHVTSSIAMFA
jgi:hypothetical protein